MGFLNGTCDRVRPSLLDLLFSTRLAALDLVVVIGPRPTTTTTITTRFVGLFCTAIFDIRRSLTIPVAQIFEKVGSLRIFMIPGLYCTQMFKQIES